MQKNCYEQEKTASCPICHDTGWIIRPDNGQGTAIECQCGLRQKEIMNRTLSFADVPEAFKNVRISNFDVTAYSNAKSQEKARIAVKVVKHWLNDFDDMHKRGMGFYFYSNAKGSGKTRMAVSIANELLHEKRFVVKFCTSIQILNAVKASWEKTEEITENKLLDLLSTVEVLIIDDFGTEEIEKTWIAERFYHIINNRYINKKITIFTSNTRLDVLPCDERITDRINERTFLIPFPEESIRKVIAKQNVNELISVINT